MLKRLRTWMEAEDCRAEGDPRAPWRLFWVAFLVRVLYITLAHTYRVHAFDDHFQFGWEAGRIARSLVSGQGYSSPFRGNTGPTAWLPPLYPLLLAAIFKIFGIYTALSAWVVLVINSLFSAATAMAVWEIGYRCFSRKNAVWSGWLWALYPAAMQYAVRWLWETSLTTLLFTWIIVLALRMRSTQNQRKASDPQPVLNLKASWIVFGLLWGGIALSNSSLLLFLPFCGLWILAGTWEGSASLRDPILAAFIFIACLAPWEMRNYVVFHRFIPIRGNLGVEEALGNGPGARGLLMEYNHPNQSIEQLHLYAEMGEVRYAEMRGELAKQTIHVNRAQFVANCIKRVYMFWAGVPSSVRWSLEVPRLLNFGFISLVGLLGLALALKKHIPAAWLFVGAFLLLPLPYYLVTVHARFRHPLEPLITVLGVYLFQSAKLSAQRTSAKTP